MKGDIISNSSEIQRTTEWYPSMDGEIGTEFHPLLLELLAMLNF